MALWILLFGSCLNCVNENIWGITGNTVDSRSVLVSNCKWSGVTVNRKPKIRNGIYLISYCSRTCEFAINFRLCHSGGLSKIIEQSNLNNTIGLHAHCYGQSSDYISGWEYLYGIRFSNWLGHLNLSCFVSVYIYLNFK